MSNEIQKLKPVERSLYRRVFMARIEGGQSPEAAHRHGLNAVKMWNEVGAFNEEPSAPRLEGETDEARAFRLDMVRRRREHLEGAVDRTDIDKVITSSGWFALCEDLIKRGIDLSDVRRRLALNVDSSG